MARWITPAEMGSLAGTELGLSDWITIDQDRIDRFADLVKDHHYIHVDAARASQTPFGGTIAHGFLVLSLMTDFMAHADLPEIADARYNVNYGSNRVRFLAPVRSGSRVRARFRLLALVEKRPAEWLETREMIVEIDGGQTPALMCEWMTLHVL